ncbi:MAG TPA: hypothetical protein VF463_07160 [Sphingobium sp.]
MTQCFDLSERPGRHGATNPEHGSILAHMWGAGIASGARQPCLAPVD